MISQCSRRGRKPIFTIRRTKIKHEHRISDQQNGLRAHGQRSTDRSGRIADLFIASLSLPYIFDPSPSPFAISSLPSDHTIALPDQDSEQHVPTPYIRHLGTDPTEAGAATEPTSETPSRDDQAQTLQTPAKDQILDRNEPLRSKPKVMGRFMQF